MTPALVVPVLGRKLYPGASVALDFTRNLYRSGTPVVKGSPSLLSGWAFARASTGYAETAAGALVAFASGAPRITDKGQLVEEARTNLLLQSQTFGTTWTVQRASVSSNAIIAPDGTLTADKIVEDSTAANTHRVFQAPTTANVAHGFSVYAKAAERSILYLKIDRGAGGSPSAWFNLGTGAVGTVETGLTATITAMADGWYRCAVVVDTTPAAAINPIIGLTTTNAVSSYSGDGVSGLYLWQADLQAGSSIGSPIVTTTTSATREADVPTLAYAPAFPVTMVCNLQRTGGLAAARTFMMLDDGTANERAILRINASNNVEARQTTGGIDVATVTTATALSALNTRYKIAGRFALNDVNAAASGAAGTADTTAAVPVGPTTLRLGHLLGGTESVNAYIKQAIIYPLGYPDAGLAAFTA